MSAAVLDDYLDGLLAPDAPAAAVPVASAPAAAAPTAGTPPDQPATPDAVAPSSIARPEPAAAGSGTSAAVAPPQPPAQPVPVAASAPPRPAPPPAPVARPMPFQVQGVAPQASAAAPAAPNDDVPAPIHRRATDRASRWLRLRCASQAYGLELLKVQEVVLPTPLLPLRGTPPAMLGVMNLRGQVVPVMDLGVYLGQLPQPESAATRIVVLEEKGETLGLRVTAVDDVANLTDQQIEPPDNARVGRIHNALFRGIARLSAEPMILLDASCLLAPSDNRRDAA